MKKIVSILLLSLGLAQPCFARMNDEDVIRGLKSLYEDRKALNELAKQRRAEEQALIEEYRVDECNQKRSAMIDRYQAQMKEISDRILATEDSLGSK